MACAVACVAGAGLAAAQPAGSPAPERPRLTTGVGGIFDATDPDIVMTVRGGVEVGPAYFGSDEYELGPDAAARLDYIRFPNGFEFGSGRTVGFRTGWGLRGTVRYIGERDSSDHEEIEGLDDVDWSFEAGLGLGYEQRNYRVFTDVRYGFIGHNAWTGDVGADGIAYPMDGLTLTLGPRLGFGDSRFANTYFGVSEAESVRSDLAPFEAEGGLLSAGVELGARYLFNERWGVEGGASWDRLLNDAADSPITEEGSADQYRVRLGITRSISLDF
jgi:outer membrane scaffolding protein for murein synthesis (MipA/OmpV family)